MPDHREPYLGDGVDGALRSAEIDREEAGALMQGDPRRHELLLSAERWVAQAHALERDDRTDAHAEQMTVGDQLHALRHYARSRGYTKAKEWLEARMTKEGL